MNIQDCPAAHLWQVTDRILKNMAIHFQKKFEVGRTYQHKLPPMVLRWEHGCGSHLMHRKKQCEDRNSYHKITFTETKKKRYNTHTNITNKRRRNICVYQQKEKARYTIKIKSSKNGIQKRNKINRTSFISTHSPREKIKKGW